MKKRIKVNIREENNEKGSVDITGLIKGEIRFNGVIIATVVDGEIKNYPLAGIASKEQGRHLEERKRGFMNQKSDSRTRNKKSFIDTKVGNPL